MKKGLKSNTKRLGVIGNYRGKLLHLFFRSLLIDILPLLPTSLQFYDMITFKTLFKDN